MFTGPGGSDIGSFTITSMTGQPLIWSNIPSVVLTALPPTTVTGNQTMGTLSVGSFTSAMAPAPPGIDLATTNYMQSTIGFVAYQ